jgi:argininosuccinate lyase
MHAFNESLSYDKRMHKADIKGSIAYAKALVLVGILTKEEGVKIVEGLKTVGREWEEGTVSAFPFHNFFQVGNHAHIQFITATDDEDIHSANERRLIELIGPLGGKLHTGRSRNDQVATDMRLWLLDELKGIEDHLKGLIRVMADRADSEKDILIPGYTHLQVGIFTVFSGDCLLTDDVPSCSGVNRSGGPISSCPTPSRFATILRDCAN